MKTMIERRVVMDSNAAPHATPAIEKRALNVLPPLSRMGQHGALPNVRLVTQHNKTVKFYDDLVQGKTVLIHFFSTQHTTDATALALKNLRLAQDLLGDKMGKDVFFLSISLQSLIGIPEHLNAYADSIAPKQGWHLLTGEPDAIELLRKSLGFAGKNRVLTTDLNDYAVIARLHNNGLKRWSMVPLNHSPERIVSAFESFGC